MSKMHDDEPEVRLAGGNMGGAVRIGQTVRRQAGPWTSTIHALLKWLRSHGATDIVPEPLGLDDHGREIVRFFPGETFPDEPPPWIWNDDILISSGELLRRIHDASLGFLDSPAVKHPVWQLPIHYPAEVICHNDPAPYNFIFNEQQISAVIDWDTAAPGPRIRDLAYLAYRMVPFASDAVLIRPLNQEKRLSDLIAAYGFPYTNREVFEAMSARLEELADFSDSLARTSGNDELNSHAKRYRADANAIRPPDPMFAYRDAF
ncbi:MAG: aminoglycoside phosphotransferase family protein [Promicromonosporaceae bacterium]|nr:aminoglycoside phosphotransferase family protein [Promicromonosporaceae bacterium]